MTDAANLAVIVGSLRAGSWSRKLAKALIARAPATLAGRIVESAASASRTGGMLVCHFVGRKGKSEKSLRSPSLSRPIDTAR